MFIAFSFVSTGICFTDCQKGKLYRDNRNIFEIVCPSNEMEFDILGIAFRDTKNYSNYLVRAFDVPLRHPQNKLTIENVLSDFKEIITEKCPIEVLKQEKTTYDDYDALDFYFKLKLDNPVYYYARLIRSKNYVIFAYLSLPSGPDSLVITNENEGITTPDLANRFLNSLKILK